MNKPVVLMLEPDRDDRFITQTFFDENNLAVRLEFAGSREAFFEELDNRDEEDFPVLILINMNASPDMAPGILRELKSDLKLAFIPVVVLCESRNEKMIRESYIAGASTVIVKPSDLSGTSSKIMSFVKYWFETAELIG